MAIDFNKIPGLDDFTHSSNDGDGRITQEPNWLESADSKTFINVITGERVPAVIISAPGYGQGWRNVPQTVAQQNNLPVAQMPTTRTDNPNTGWTNEDTALIAAFTGGVGALGGFGALAAGGGGSAGGGGLGGNTMLASGYGGATDIVPIVDGGAAGAGTGAAETGGAAAGGSALPSWALPAAGLASSALGGGGGDSGGGTFTNNGGAIDWTGGAGTGTGGGGYDLSFLNNPTYNGGAAPGTVPDYGNLFGGQNTDIAKLLGGTINLGDSSQMMPTGTLSDFAQNFDFSKFGDAANSGGLGNSLLNGLKGLLGTGLGSGGATVGSTLPGLLALAYAAQQPGADTSQLQNVFGQLGAAPKSPYDPSQLQTILGKLGGNQDAIVQAATDPFQKNIAAGYGDLLQSQGLRGIRGSSFGDTDIANFLSTTGRGLADAGASATQQSLTTQAGLASQIAGLGGQNAAFNQGNLALQGNLASQISQFGLQNQGIKNNLYGTAFNILGRGLNPTAYSGLGNLPSGL